MKIFSLFSERKKLENLKPMEFIHFSLKLPITDPDTGISPSLHPIINIMFASILYGEIDCVFQTYHRI